MNQVLGQIPTPDGAAPAYLVKISRGQYAISSYGCVEPISSDRAKHLLMVVEPCTHAHDIEDDQFDLEYAGSDADLAEPPPIRVTMVPVVNVFAAVDGMLIACGQTPAEYATARGFVADPDGPEIQEITVPWALERA